MAFSGSSQQKGACYHALPLQAEHQTTDILPASQHKSAQDASESAQDPSLAVDAAKVSLSVTEDQTKKQSSKGPLLKHINFWHEDELKMAHPEVQVRVRPSPSPALTLLLPLAMQSGLVGPAGAQCNLELRSLYNVWNTACVHSVQ